MTERRSLRSALSVEPFSAEWQWDVPAEDDWRVRSVDFLIWGAEVIQPLIDGFCKWDGCMQFRWTEELKFNVHIDSEEHWKAIHDAVVEVRRECLRICAMDEEECR